MSGHIVEKKLYYTIFAVLMVLTGITVWVAFIDLGFLSDVVALTIAVTKATLVVLYFMHVRYSTRLTWLVVASGFFWLFILFVFTMSDYLSRDVTPDDPRFRGQAGALMVPADDPRLRATRPGSGASSAPDAGPTATPPIPH
jgi:cytochrome c oxidase subunit IV